METQQTTTYPYLVLKYYHYVPINDIAKFREQHHLYCIKQNLRGRIKIAPEGINGTISGLVKNCEKYMAYIKSDPRFKKITFNIAPSPTHVHEKLHVRLKPEIIRADLSCDIDERKHELGKDYINGEMFENMKNDKDVVIIDVRSNYEHNVGKFKESITYNIDNFRAFFTETVNQRFDKNKKYIVICTRGIKSVKGWHYFKEVHRLPNVYYLQGGILDYAQQTEGNEFEGVCYVFDKRLIVPINKNTLPISRCYSCQQPSNRMINCANPNCNIHLPMCEPCNIKLEGGCSEACQKHPEKRPYNGIGYYIKQLNGYNPYIGLHRR